MEEREIDLLDYLRVLLKWWKLILFSFIAACLIAGGISFLLPRWYTARTTVLSPQEQVGGLGSMLLAKVPVGELGIPSVSTPASIYVAILKSRTVCEGVIRKLNLIPVYKAKNLEEAVLTLSRRTRIRISEEGVVQLEVTDRSPQRAADIANTYVEELDRVNTELNVSRARNNRIFIERRLAQNRRDLWAAEEALRRFKEEYKTIALPEQTKAAIEAAAKVKAQIVTAEVELGVMLKTMNPTHPQVLQLQSRINELKKQLAQMEFGGTNPNPEDRVYVPLAQVPSVSLELARLTREVKVQEAIFELLTQEYERAKIQEARDTPTIQVLDRAVPPVKSSKPRRRLIVTVAGTISLFGSVLLAFFLEFLRRSREERRVPREPVRRTRPVDLVKDQSD